MNILSTHNENSLKQPLLSRALQQSEMNNNHLFSAVESKEAKLFELVKHLSGPIYISSFCYIMSSSDGATIESTNEFIITAAKDLLSKL